MCVIRSFAGDFSSRSFSIIFATPLLCQVQNNFVLFTFYGALMGFIDKFLECMREHPTLSHVPTSSIHNARTMLNCACVFQPHLRRVRSTLQKNHPLLPVGLTVSHTVRSHSTRLSYSHAIVSDFSAVLHSSTRSTSLERNEVPPKNVALDSLTLDFFDNLPRSG